MVATKAGQAGSSKINNLRYRFLESGRHAVGAPIERRVRPQRTMPRQFFKLVPLQQAHDSARPKL